MTTNIQVYEYIIFGIIALFVAVILLLPVRNIEVAGKRGFVLLFLLIVAGGGMAVYSVVGSPEILSLLAQREEKITRLKDNITKNAALVKATPDNLRAWVEIGDDFMETGQFSAARNAFRRAVLLSGGNPILIMAYARAMIAEADGKITDDAKKSIDMVLLLSPENEEARYFTAVWKLQNGDTKNAMSDMKNLYRSLPDDSPIKSMINRQIGRGRE